jgi:hypothetical protein
LTSHTTFIETHSKREVFEKAMNLHGIDHFIGVRLLDEIDFEVE